jgi:hypothetical protein
MASPSQSNLLAELKRVAGDDAYQALVTQAGDEAKLYQTLKNAGISSFSTSAARKFAWQEVLAWIVILICAAALLYVLYSISGYVIESIKAFFMWLSGH